MPHHRSSSCRSFSRNNSRSRTCTIQQTPSQNPKKNHLPAQIKHHWKTKERTYKQVTIDDQPSEYYSSDEPDSDSEDDLNLEEPSPSTTFHKWGGLPNKDPVTVAHITDCPTIMVHTGKHYKALIDSGAAISLLRYSTYKKKLKTATRHPYNPSQLN